MNKLALATVFLIVFVSGCASQPVSETTTTTIATSSEGETKEFSMIARQWEFDPPVITVNEGDTVRLIIRSVDVTHGIAIPQFGINRQLMAGQTTTIQFVADKAGTYTFFCSVFCGAGHSEMKGTLIVQ